MSSALNLKIDLGSQFATLRQQFADLEAKQIGQAAARALNRVGVSARQAAAPVIARELDGALPEPVIRRAIKFRNARGDRLYIDLRAVGGRNLAARLFRPRQTKTGVTIRVGSRSVRIDGAFLTQKGAVRVRGPDWKAQRFDQMRLRTKRLRRGNVPDLPIPQIVLPGVPRVFLEGTVVEAVRRVARERFPVEFARELEVRSRGLVKARR